MRRRFLLRSADEPAWTRPALLVLAAAAAVVYAWGINSAQLHTYYAPAVKSMSESWKAFFYGGYDPAASITLDKLPGSFMVQALSARIFGFHTWSVILPQVVAGVGAVLVLYRVVQRWQGAVAGIVAAALLATMPVLAALAHSQISDGILVLLLVLAAGAAQRALTTGRLRTLLLCGVWVGLAFQTKMVQAWGVLPAFAVAYLVAAPVPPSLRTGWRAAPLWRRLGHVGLAGLVTLAVSMWQVILFLVTPASVRPYADGSTDNSLFSMIFEYNLSTRFGVNSTTAVNFGGGGGGPQGPGGGSSTNWQYMISDQVAPQVGWAYPLAVAGLVLGLLGWRRRSDFAGYLMWGVWLVVHAAAFTTGRVAHSFYVVAVAPAVAALAAGGLVLLWRQYRTGAWFLLPAVVAANVAWILYLCSRFADFRSWLTPVVAAVGAIAVVLLVAARFVTRLGRLAVGGGVLALATVLIAPAAWASSTVESQYRGSSIGPAAGPEGGLGGFGGGPRGGGQGRGGYFEFPGGGQLTEPPGGQQPGASGPPQGSAGGRGPGGGFGGLGSEPTAETKALLAWLKKNNTNGEKYLIAAQGSMGIGGQLILAGASVLPMGGFSGQVPFPTADQVAKLVAEHKLRYVMLGGGRGGPGGPGGQGEGNAPLQTWITSHCTQLTAEGQSLYDCR